MKSIVTYAKQLQSLFRYTLRYQSTLSSANIKAPIAIGKGNFAAKKLSGCTLGRSGTQLSSLPPVGYINLGRVSYQKALQLQQQLCRKRIDEIYIGTQRAGRSDRRLSDVLVLLEHPPVYTNGRRNRGRLSSAEIDQLCVFGEYVETNRGGEITFHGPGQLVAYPIMYLKDHFLGAKCFVKGLENTIIETCARFGVDADRMDGFPGVWVSPTQKVAALGTHVQKYVTSHGFALNCTTDMKWFEQIIPCGLDGKTATSLQHILSARTTRIGGKPKMDTSVDAVLPVVVDSFATVFGCDVQPLAQLSPVTFAEIQNILSATE